MYQLKEWSEDLDLNSFYSEANRRGFVNNSSQKLMVDCFSKEERFKVWVLYQNDKPIGSVAAHSLPELGPNSYRICARTCTFAEAHPRQGLITVKRLITEHQNLTAQFFIPANIEFCGKDSNMYISTHPSDVGTQRIVHNLYCPTLEKIGTVSKQCELEYRGHVQTFWKLNVDVFLEQLSRYPRWDHPQT